MKTSHARHSRRFVLGALLGSLLTLSAVLATAGTGAGAAARRASSGTVWLCRPGLAGDPCTASLSATVVSSTGGHSVATAKAASKPGVDCFYIYPTVSRELQENADLSIQKTEIAAAVAQASRFSSVCSVWAPIYRQVTDYGLAQAPNLNVPAAATDVAYSSLQSAFSGYLAHDNDGRPMVFIGSSQGAAMLILLLKRMVDDDPSLRSRLVAAIILGGNVEVPKGATVGGTFAHIPLCTKTGEAGCVIAYSSFPSEPPSNSLFGRPGQGVSLQSGETSKKGLAVACTNPAALGGGSGLLDPYFPSGRAVSTPWVAYPGLYTARCESGGGATWLSVSKATGSSDRRPTVTEADGPQWGYHADDVNLGLGNLVSDVQLAATSYESAHRH